MSLYLDAVTVDRRNLHLQCAYLEDRVAALKARLDTVTEKLAAAEMREETLVRENFLLLQEIRELAREDR